METLKEETYIKLPERFERYLKEKNIWIVNRSENCSLLPKSIYGFVQAARQWRKSANHFVQNGFFQKSKKDLTPIIIYVDDGRCIRNEKYISKLERTVKRIKNKRLWKMKICQT
jgi:hypothetical protein